MKFLPHFLLLVLLISTIPASAESSPIIVSSSQLQSSSPSLDAWDIFIDKFLTMDGITFNKSDTVQVYLRITNLESTPAKIRYSIDYGSESYKGRASVRGSDSYELKKDFRPAQYGTNTIQVKLYNTENKLIDERAITFHVDGNVYTDDISSMEEKVKTQQTELHNTQTSIMDLSGRIDTLEADTGSMSATTGSVIGALLTLLAIAAWKGDFFRKKEFMGHAGSVPFIVESQEDQGHSGSVSYTTEHQEDQGHSGQVEP